MVSFFLWQHYHSGCFLFLEESAAHRAVGENVWGCLSLHGVAPQSAFFQFKYSPPAPRDIRLHQTVMSLGEETIAQQSFERIWQVQSLR